jgi:PiT family inorganic phosphate transporter
MEFLVFLAALFVAFSNGANDNFKGFATVWGSGILSYRQALTLATIATLAGCLMSLVLAQSLVQQFSGKGLVPNTLVHSLPFIGSVASAAAITVFMATRLGFPVSTTHALIGALVGAGLSQGIGAVNFSTLTNTFLLPLLISPILAAILGIVFHRLFRSRLKRPLKDCVCGPIVSTPTFVLEHHSAIQQTTNITFIVTSQEACENISSPVHLTVSKTLNGLHIGSAIAICFARSVNDTPKLVALLIAAHMLNQSGSVILIAVVMGLGGVMFAHRVAQTMSQRITQIDHASGLTANLITATLVLFASQFGLPVSTTHVAVGSIVGVGASSKALDWLALRNILWSWIITLPFAAGIAWVLFVLID